MEEVGDDEASADVAATIGATVPILSNILVSAGELERDGPFRSDADNGIGTVEASAKDANDALEASASTSPL